MNETTQKEIPFLFYVKEGKTISNKEILKMGHSLDGWFSCAGVLRNRDRHTQADISESLKELSNFVKSLKAEERIQETDLLQYV